MPVLCCKCMQYSAVLLGLVVVSLNLISSNLISLNLNRADVGVLFPLSAPEL